jgi:hypothetical protein
MAVAMFMQWAGVTADDYESLHGPVNWEGDTPAGLRFHLAAFDATGGRIVDIWDSEEHFNRFLTERLMPEIQRQGRMQGQPDVSFVPVHATFAPSRELEPA